MTIEESYNHFVKKLNSIYDLREAGNITDWVFESVAGIKRIERLIRKNEQLNFKLLDVALKDLLTAKPVQYVLGEAWFCKMKFKVNEHVLIPRPETEELVEGVSQLLSGYGGPSLRSGVRMKNPAILDIGTGSGCIAISLKKALPGVNVMGIDVSADALELAKENARDLDSDVSFIQLDFLDEKSWKELSKYDVIVSNPPYIPLKEKEKLAKNVTHFEPGVALFVADEDPFIFYRKIGDFSKDHLNENGKIFVEVHQDFATPVAEIFQQQKLQTEIKKDMFGKDRIIIAG